MSKNTKHTKPMNLRDAQYLSAVKSSILVLSGYDLSVIQSGKATVLSNHAGSFALVLSQEGGLKCLECRSTNLCDHCAIVRMWQRRLSEILEAK